MTKNTMQHCGGEPPRKIMTYTLWTVQGLLALLRIQPNLTPLAAAGLTIVMTGATVLTLAGGAVALALVPLMAGLLSAFVAYGRFANQRSALCN
jgi:hypothetical protein